MSTTFARFSFLFLFIATVLLAVNDGFELPFLQSCTIEDEKCHIEQFNKFIELYSKGIKELDVPPLDPLPLGNITIKSNSNENFNLNLQMENVKLYKYPVVKCLSIKGFTKDPTKPMRVVFKTISPQLIVKAHCRIKGKLLLFTVAGETDIVMDIKNVKATLKTKLTAYTKDGQTYNKLDEIKPKLDIGSLSTSFANSTLFNGEEVFMKTFEDTINGNWEVLRDEVEPHLNDVTSKVQMDILNKILATIPYDKYFKKSD